TELPPVWRGRPSAAEVGIAASTYDQWPVMSMIWPDRSLATRARSVGMADGPLLVMWSRDSWRLSDRMVRHDDLGGEVVQRTRVRLDRGQGSSDCHRGFVWQPLGATQ